MNISRKTSKDLLKEYNEALASVVSVENRITEKLLFLCKKYPEAPIQYNSISREDYYMARSINNRFFIETLPVQTRVQYMEMIETYLSNKVAVQLDLFEEKK